MTSTAPISGPAPELASAQSAPTPAPAAPGSQTPATPTGNDADLRLVIEEDKAAGSYVYLTINAATGQVVSQVPREQLLKMRENPDYQPGSVVDSHS
jgi:flagellar protein FlaG